MKTLYYTKKQYPDYLQLAHKGMIKRNHKGNTIASYICSEFITKSLKAHHLDCRP